MFVPIPTRVGRVKLMGVKDDAMYLSELRTTYQSRHCEVIEAPSQTTARSANTRTSASLSSTRRPGAQKTSECLCLHG